MEDFPHQTVAEFVFCTIIGGIGNLWHHAIADDLGVAVDDGIKKGFVTIYRLVFVCAWVPFMLLMFQDGSASVSRAMIKDKLNQDDVVDRRESIDGKEACVETRVPNDVDTRSRDVQQPPRREPIAQTFRRCLRGWLLSTLYYSVLICLFCIIDFVLDLRQTSTRCMAFMLASVLSAPLHMLWTNTLISPQLPETLWPLPSLSRIFSLRSLGALLVASLAYSGSQVFCTVGSVLIVHQLTAPVHMTLANPFGDLFTILTMVGITFTCVHVPAAILLIRIEWSLMPDHETPEVSEDCTKTLPISERPLAHQPKRKIEPLRVMRSTYLPVFCKTLKVYWIFVAALVAGIVLFMVG